MSVNMNIKKEPGTPSSIEQQCGHLMEIKKELGSTTSTTMTTDSPGGVASSSTTSWAVTSKSQLSSKVKMALVHAWRDRWTEIEWAIQLKKLLAAYSNDNVDVAEILMEQGLVGSSPNSLILSYLKHSVLSQMIPFHSVLKCITRFEDFSRPYCILALLNLAEMFGSKICLNNCQEMPLQMVGSLRKLLHWLVKALLTCLKKVPDNSSTSTSSNSNNNLPREYFVIMDNSSRAIYNILERQAVRSLMQIAKHDNMEEYREFEQCMMNARGTLSQLSASCLPEETREKISKALANLSRIEEHHPIPDPVLTTSHSPLCPIIHGLVSLEAILNRTSDTQPFVSQLVTVSKLARMSIPQVCLEIFRACFMGFLDTSDYSEDLVWATFTFLRVPQILNKMKQQLPDRDISQDVETGVTMLLEYSHLLDPVDIKLGCDMLSFLISECVKSGVLNEAQKTTLSQKRLEQRKRVNMQDTSSGHKNMLRVTQAETTVNSILKSLDSDPVKNSETLVKVLNMLNGNYLEIVRLAASGMGRMNEFITKMVRINEFASHTPSTDMTSRAQRSQLFDTTFLMITCIIQQSGMEQVVQPSRENEASLVIQWARRWLPQDGRYKNPDMTSGEDQEKVDRILNLLLTKGDITPGGMVSSWKDLIMHLPYALQEILYALEHQAISLDSVKTILEHVRHQNTKCLVLVAVSYLCSYMNLVGTSARVKPLMMLEFLTQGLDSAQLKNITDGIMYEILPEGHPQRLVRSYTLPPGRLTGEIMRETLTESFHRGWLNLSSLHTLDQLLALRGTDWVVTQMVQLLLATNQSEDVYQALHLAFAIMHMDLERMTVSLLHTVLPRLLTQSTSTMTQGHPGSGSSSSALSLPRGHCLAKLCVLCITATKTYKFGQKDPYVRRLCKRSIIETEYDEDLEETDTSPCKLRKMSEPQVSFSVEEFNLDMLADKEENPETLPNFVLKEPFNKVLVNLFHLMNWILSLPTLTPHTWFIVSFIKEAIKCGGEHSRFILQFMPPNMLSQIMRCLPGVFSSDNILRICDLSSPSGRKVAAKVICNNSQVAPLEILE